MAKGKDARVIVFLECTSCARNSFNKKKKTIGRFKIYYSKESTQYTRSIRIKKILTILSQTYDSRRDKEIELVVSRASVLCLFLK
uniref:ribosomal protein L33 n=1 Tax=Peperomia griseoargentea TaxID=69412 RepID=UPI0030FF09DC